MFKDATPAGRRYTVRFLSAMAIYAAIFFAARPFEAHYASTPLRIAIALGLALSVMGVIAAIGRYLVEEADEYQRMMQAQAVIWATGITLSVSTLWGYLAVMRLAPDLPSVDVFVVFNAGWLLITAVRKLAAAFGR